VIANCATWVGRRSIVSGRQSAIQTDTLPKIVQVVVSKTIVVIVVQIRIGCVDGDVLHRPPVSLLLE
jgi:hypothetical protein